MEQENTDRIWALIARKFSGDATSEELVELEQLLLQNPHENYSMEILNDLWNSKAEMNRQYSENKYKELVLRMQHIGIDEGKFTDADESVLGEEEQSPKKTKKWFMWLASFTAISISLFFLIQYNRADNGKIKQPELLAKNEINTKYGSKTNLVLPDGTKVWLNAGSKMTYDKNYGTDQREVSLTGEAYFDVVKNPAKPFIIHTSSINIRVLGTAFNVRCYPDEKNIETSLLRGSLEVTFKNGQEKIILKPNEKLTVNNSEVRAEKDNSPVKTTATTATGNVMELGHLSVMPQDNSIVETSWVNNKLIFRSETFEEVAIKMERWYAVDISFADERLKTKKLTGTFENETVDQALAAIQLTTSFSYSINNDKIIISK